MILSLFRKDPLNDAADALFAAVAAQARAPSFYLLLGVEDSVDGRFEMLALHVYLLLRRLKSEAGARGLAQLVFDSFFGNLDSALREMGVGDLSVGRKIRGLAENFYGRVSAYEKGLSAESNDELVAALSRNVFEATAAPTAPALAVYVREVDAFLAAQPAGRLIAGVVAFPAPPQEAR
ncbi:MAG TPA: ubiquinol-cytochrome C chaperone family protein [Parvularculaceae bacterium]|nr:ubiquinol-cytochrome C chaperone family protein [Parvularculaceae bacterium]